MDFSSFAQSELTVFAQLIQPRNIASLKVTVNEQLQQSPINLFFTLCSLDEFT